MNCTELKGKSHKGFTLVELIMSIAIVAFLSGIVLQLFITAQNLNKRASDLDRCVQKSEEVISDFKACSLPSDFSSTGTMKNAARYKDAGSLVYLLKYDGNWVAQEKNSDAAKAYFVMRVQLTPRDKKGLWRLSITVEKSKYRYLEKKLSKPFYSIQASQYFWKARVN